MSQRRRLANLRERRRMMLINRGFELLRDRLPIYELVESLKLVDETMKGRRFKLTKVDILRLTIEYIKKLAAMLDGDQDVNQSTLSSHDATSVVNLSNDSHSIIELRRDHQKELVPRSSVRCRSSGRRLKPTRIFNHHVSSDTIMNSLQLATDRHENSHIVFYWRFNKSIESPCYVLSWSKCTKNEEQFDLCQDPQGTSGSGKRLTKTKLWIPEKE